MLKVCTIHNSLKNHLFQKVPKIDWNRLNDSFS